MAYTSFIHDPDSVLDYQWDFADSTVGPWLATGDTIVDATVTVIGVNDDDETPCAVDSFSFDDTTVTAWISGGNITYSPYVVTAHITTAAGREDDRSISLKIRER